ncbi:MAG: hypothetical protein V8Q54_00680 [Alistipes senegalensis]
MPLALSSPCGARGLPALSGSSAPPLFILKSALGLGVWVTSSLPATCAVCSTGAATSCTRGSVAIFTGGFGGSGTGGSVKSTRIVSPGFSTACETSNDTSANEPASSTQ